MKLKLITWTQNKNEEILKLFGFIPKLDYEKDSLSVEL
jgi:hypothetical protein